MPYPEMEHATTFKLTLITKKARERTKLKFTSLMHLLNADYVRERFSELKANKAPGVDRRTWESYSDTEIIKVVEQTVTALKNHTYRPQPVRRVFIPKTNGKQRPLGIPTVIDKTLQLACAKILEPLFEPLFLDCSYGFRPHRNAHEALKSLNHIIMGQRVNWITRLDRLASIRRSGRQARQVDADIQGFFDHVNHEWLMKCLEQRIADPNFLWLIRKSLNAGVMNEGRVEPTGRGTPQGGIISPLLANIYLHYVLDLWFEKKIKPQLRGYASVIRYADDFVIGVQYKEEAETLVMNIRQRFNQFGLTLAEDKTRILEFGRFAQENVRTQSGGKSQTFDFLGFTHYCSKTRDGRFSLNVKTSRKKFTAAVKRERQWLKSVRNLVKLPRLWRTLASKLQGHYQYYGMSGNFEGIKRYYERVLCLTYYWMNRRSQRRTWNWSTFRDYLARYPLPKPTLTYAIYNTW